MPFSSGYGQFCKKHEGFPRPERCPCCVMDEAKTLNDALRAENECLHARNKHLLEVLKRALPGLKWARSTLGNGTHIGYSIAEISRVLKEATALAAGGE